MPKLRVKHKGEWTDVPVNGERFLIGRGSECDYIIDSGFISRKHCLIVHEEDGYHILDLHSKMGTALNGNQIKEKADLNMGDRIRLAGRLDLVFMGDVEMAHTETMVAVPADTQRNVQRLVGLNGPVAGREYPLYRSVTRIGRSDENNLHIAVDTISNFHAEITREDGELILRDLDSGNGSFVNGEQVEQQLLKPKDIIVFDWVSFRYEDTHFRMDKSGTLLSGKFPVPLPPTDQPLPDDQKTVDPVDVSLAMDPHIGTPTERYRTFSEPDPKQPVFPRKKKSNLASWILGGLFLLLVGAAAWIFLF